MTVLMLAAQAIYRSAATDARTGLLTYDAWYARADHALMRDRSDVSSSALFIVDIDRLKELNDSYGHLAGDSVIAAVARALQAEVRQGETDMVGRFGGDEFVVFIDNVSGESDAVAIAERVRCAVGALRVPVGAAGRPVTLTGLSVSIGVAAVSGVSPDRHLATLLHKADRALYRAKHAGRNTVHAARDLPPPGAAP